MDIVSPETRSKMMRAVKCRNSRPEMIVRSLVHSMGYRYRLHVKGLPGTPDLVFPRLRKVVFVHGCFWHRHGCKHTTTPTSRQEYWQKKFRENIARDSRDSRNLKELGWKILIVWECRTKDLGKLGEKLHKFLSR